MNFWTDLWTNQSGQLTGSAHAIITLIIALAIIGAATGIVGRFFKPARWIGSILSAIIFVTIWLIVFPGSRPYINNLWAWCCSQLQAAWQIGTTTLNLH